MRESLESGGCERGGDWTGLGFGSGWSARPGVVVSRLDEEG
jgi:hypothetical protein